MNGYPEGWGVAALGEVCDLYQPKTISAKDLVSDAPYPVFGANGIIGRYTRYNHAESEVLITCRGATCGTINVSQPFSWITGNAMVASPRDNRVDKGFLRWVLQYSDFDGVITGTAQPQITRSKLSPMTIPVPPIDEQRRIVQVIDQQFSRLDAAEASMARSLRNLDRLRRATISGSLDGDWPEVELASIIESLRNGVFVSRPAKSPPGLPIFRISAVRPMRLNVEDIRYATLPAADAEGYFVEPGDLLFTRYSGNPAFVGACAVVPQLATPTLHPDKLIRVVLDRSKALPAFVSLTVNNGAVRRQIESRLKTTAGQVGISGSQLRSVRINLPPLEAQRKIVDNVSWKLSAYDVEIRDINVTLRRSQQLRRGVLEAAFSGRLAPQAIISRSVPSSAAMNPGVESQLTLPSADNDAVTHLEIGA